MNKGIAREMWQSLLYSVILGNGAKCLKNPMLEFSMPGKSGVHNELSDSQYAECVYGYMQQSYSVWRGEHEKSAVDLLINALETTQITSECLKNLIELLADASVKTNYQTGSDEESEQEILYTTDPETEAEAVDEAVDESVAFGDWIPKEIERWLHTKGGIVGQDAAVKTASLILYNHINGRPSVNLFAAPTGSGKTHLWRVLQKACGANNIVIHDASSLTAEGWKGSNKISTIFKDIPPEHRGHIILVLDEFDKLLEPQYGSSGTNYSDIVQNGLLRLCDHDTLFFGSESDQGFSVDTSGISVVLLGAFQRLMEKKSCDSGAIGFGGQPHRDYDYGNSEITVEDLVEYGMRGELAGRITRITCMSPLSIDDLVRIGENEVKNMESLMHRGITVDISTLLTLSGTALEKGLGARWLKSQLRNMLDELIYNTPEAVSYKIEYNPPQADECIQTAAFME